MRITYIHQHYRLPNQPGGSRPYEFSRRLAADGHQVTMICAGAEPLDADVEGVHVKRLAVNYNNAMGFAARVGAFLAFMARATVVAASERADVVLASSTPLTVAVPGMIAAKLRRAPFVFEVRDLWPSVPVQLGLLKNPVLIRLAEALEKVTYSQAKRVIALSPSMAEGVRQVRPDAQVMVVPNAADFERFDRTDEERAADRREFGWGEDELVLVYAGGFGMTYQLDWAVRLADELRRLEHPGKRIRVVLHGQGSDYQNLHRLATDLGLDADGLLPGALSKDEVARRVAAADAVLSPLRDDPSLAGNSLNKVFDAMAAGRPVFFNHGGWLEEAMTEGGAGWRLSRDPKEAARRLCEIVTDPAALPEAARKATEVGRTRFDRETLYQDFAGELRRAAEEQDR